MCHSVHCRGCVHRGESCVTVSIVVGCVHRDESCVTVSIASADVSRVFIAVTAPTDVSRVYIVVIEPTEVSRVSIVVTAPTDVSRVSIVTAQSLPMRSALLILYSTVGSAVSTLLFDFIIFQLVCDHNLMLCLSFTRVVCYTIYYNITLLFIFLLLLYYFCIHLHNCFPM